MRMSIQNKTITNRCSFLKQKNLCTDSLGGCGEYEPPWSLGYSETYTFGFQYDMSLLSWCKCNKKNQLFFYEPWTVSHDLNPAKYQPKIIPPFEKNDL